MMRARRAAGFVLVAAACVGFVTVADDFRHAGEFFAVGGLLAAGLALVLDGVPLPIARRTPLRWVAVGIGIGELAGAAAGHLPAGVVCGALAGAIGSAALEVGAQESRGLLAGDRPTGRAAGHPGDGE